MGDPVIDQVVEDACACRHDPMCLLDRVLLALGETRSVVSCYAQRTVQLGGAVLPAPEIDFGDRRITLVLATDVDAAHYGYADVQQLLTPFADQLGIPDTVQLVPVSPRGEFTFTTIGVLTWVS